MSKSPAARAHQNARFQHRVRRDKAAAILFAGTIGTGLCVTSLETLKVIAKCAVEAVDILLAELDRKEPNGG